VTTVQPDHESAIAAAAYTRHRRIHRSSSHPRPRVIQLLATGSSGGAQESYTGLLLGLDRSRYEVGGLSLSAGSAVQRLRRLGVTVDVLDEEQDEAAVRALADRLRRDEIDLVHAHMYRAEVVGTRAAVAAGTPVIVATVHSSRVRSPEDVRTLAELTPAMDRLIVPSASIADKVRAEARGTARFAVVPNGVDLSRWSAPVPPCALRNEYGIPHDAPLIGVVARLEAEKGQRHLIDAMPAVLRAAPDAHLVIVGEGSEADALRERAATLGSPVTERVLFTGRRDDVSALTADLTVAVLPSLREAQGISLLEAMARRVAVVASDVGGIPEVVTDGVDGLLVPPAEPEALAAAILRLVRDADLRRRLGEAGHRTVAERFSIDAQVRRTEAVYDEELARAGVLLDNASAAAPPDERGALELPPI
jgi:L-malate glycosyltransferase